MTTKTTGQRTPGPYHAGDFGLILSEIDKIIGQAEGINKDNNAAYIVQACNNHDALVKALQDLFEHCAMVHKCWGNGDNTKEAAAAIKAGEAAIKSATGQE